MPSTDTSASSSESVKVVLYGAFSGVCARTATAPFDFLKLRFQLASLTSNPEYKSLHTAFRTVMKEEGITSFWRGNVAGVWLYAVYGAIQFSIYDRLKEARLGPFWAGAGSSMGATLLSYPLDLIRTRHALQQGEQQYYRGIVGTIIKIRKTEGIRGLYRGIVPSLGQVVPYMGLAFYSYDAVKKTLIQRGIFTDTSCVDLIAGMISGGIAKTTIMPIDTIRRRMQIQGSNYYVYVLRGLPKLKGFINCIIYIAKQEGVGGFFRGLSLALMKAIPNSAITFLFFGASKR